MSRAKIGNIGFAHPVNFFWMFCQHLKYSLSTFWHVSSPHRVTARPSELSNMKA